MNATRHPSILIVEDDVRLAELMRGYLESNGFVVLVETRGEGVVERVRREMPELIILDLGLPGQDGLSICKQLQSFYRNPILILTARDNDIDQVLGLELGADDYVVKPVEPRVLLARIHALLRRGKPAPVEVKKLSFGSLVIDITTRSVTLRGQLLTLSTNEFDLLVCLASRAGRIQSRELLYQQLYRREYDGLDRTLDVRVSHLRKKLGDENGDAERIKTVWGQGYLFVPTGW
jgi:DNA-binding response OmpR family regulator